MTIPLADRLTLVAAECENENYHTAAEALRDAAKEIARLTALCTEAATKNKELMDLAIKAEVARGTAATALIDAEFARDLYKHHVEQLCNSMHPHEKEHPTMFKAKTAATQLLKDGPPPLGSKEGWVAVSDMTPEQLNAALNDIGLGLEGVGERKPS